MSYIYVNILCDTVNPLFSGNLRLADGAENKGISFQYAEERKGKFTVPSLKTYRMI
jgi:hypothetical protein